MGARAGERVCVGGWGALWGYVRAGVLLLVALLFGGRSEVADSRVVRCVRRGSGRLEVRAFEPRYWRIGGRSEVADNGLRRTRLR